MDAPLGGRVGLAAPPRPADGPAPVPAARSRLPAGLGAGLSGRALASRSRHPRPRNSPAPACASGRRVLRPRPARPGGRVGCWATPPRARREPGTPCSEREGESAHFRAGPESRGADTLELVHGQGPISLLFLFFVLLSCLPSLPRQDPWLPPQAVQ